MQEIVLESMALKATEERMRIKSLWKRILGYFYRYRLHEERFIPDEPSEALIKSRGFYNYLMGFHRVVRALHRVHRRNRGMRTTLWETLIRIFIACWQTANYRNAVVTAWRVIEGRDQPDDMLIFFSHYMDWQLEDLN